MEDLNKLTDGYQLLLELFDVRWRCIITCYDDSREYIGIENTPSAAINVALKTAGII